MERFVLLLLLVALGAACPCPQSEGQEVCGSDHVTYPSQCALQCAMASQPDLSLLHEGPCEATAAAERRGRFLRDISCVSEAASCQRKCGSSIRVYFTCRSDGKADCSCLPGTGTCTDERTRCERQCGGSPSTFTCTNVNNIAQAVTCRCSSAPSPAGPDCSAYAASCEKICGSKPTNLLCHLDHENIVNKSCTCGGQPNSAHRTHTASLAALASSLLWMATWINS